MDIADIARLARLAREVAVPPVDGIAVTLRIPTHHESALIYAAAQDRQQAHPAHAADPHAAPAATSGAALVDFARASLLAAVVDLQGALVRHVLPSHTGPEPLPLQCLAQLLDARPDLEQAWQAALQDGIAQRRTAQDAAEKN